MISAQTDTQMQERLIEKYMALPNQVWDNIILQATQVNSFGFSKKAGACYNSNRAIMGN